MYQVIKYLAILIYPMVLFSQFKNEQQIYEMENDVIKLEFFTDKFYLNSNDTIKITLKVKNISNMNLYFYKYPQIILSKDKGSILIDWGYESNSKIATIDTMIILKRGRHCDYTFNIYSADLYPTINIEYIKAVFGIAYIWNLDNSNKLEKYIKNKSIEFQNDIILINSVIKEIFLTYQEMRIFTYVFKK